MCEDGDNMISVLYNVHIVGRNQSKEYVLAYYASTLLIDNLHCGGLAFPSIIPSSSCSYHCMNPY